MIEIIKNHKDELHLLETQYKSRIGQGVKHINLDEYRIRIRMIRIFLEELETINLECQTNQNEIEKLTIQLNNYKGLLASTPQIKMTGEIAYVKCLKCVKPIVGTTSYCKKHLTEEVDKAKIILEQS